MNLEKQGRKQEPPTVGVADAAAVPLSGAGLEGLAALIGRAAPGHDRLPPVERWDPPLCGEIDIVIDIGGRWSYLGSPIGREPLVRLFSTVLRREATATGIRYLLVTPVEKLVIRVADVPFLAVEMHSDGEGPMRRLTVRTNVGDVVAVDPARPLRFAVDGEGGVRPYVTVRGGLEARFTRALWMELAEMIEEDDGRPGVWSGGAFFPVPNDVPTALSAGGG